jgi:hypothetical protein
MNSSASSTSLFWNLCITSPIIPIAKQLLAGALSGALVTLIINLFNLSSTYSSTSQRYRSIEEEDLNIVTKTPPSRLAATWTQVGNTIASLTSTVVTSVLELLVDYVTLASVIKSRHPRNTGNDSANADSSSDRSINTQRHTALYQLRSIIIYASILALLAVAFSGFFATILDSPGYPSSQLSSILTNHPVFMIGLQTAAYAELLAKSSQRFLVQPDSSSWSFSTPQSVQFKFSSSPMTNTTFNSIGPREICTVWDETTSLLRCFIVLDIQNSTTKLLLQDGFFKFDKAGNLRQATKSSEFYDLTYTTCVQMDFLDGETLKAASRIRAADDTCRAPNAKSGVLVTIGTTPANTTVYHVLTRTHGNGYFRIDLATTNISSGLSNIFTSRVVDMEKFYLDGIHNSSTSIIKSSNRIAKGVFVSYDGMGGAEIAHCAFLPEAAEATSFVSAIQNHTIFYVFEVACSFVHLSSFTDKIHAEPGLRQLIDFQSPQVHSLGLGAQESIVFSLTDSDDKRLKCSNGQDVGSSMVFRVPPKNIVTGAPFESLKETSPTAYEAYRCARAFWSGARSLLPRVSSVVPSILYSSLAAVNSSAIKLDEPNTSNTETTTTTTTTTIKKPQQILEYEVTLSSNSMRVSVLLGFLLALIALTVLNRLLDLYGRKTVAVFLGLGGCVALDATTSSTFERGSTLESESDGKDREGVEGYPEMTGDLEDADEGSHGKRLYRYERGDCLDWEGNHEKFVGVGGKLRRRRNGQNHYSFNSVGVVDSHELDSGVVF